MLSLGFITLNLKQEDTYFTEIATRAKKHNIRCYRFVPSQMNPLTEKVNGEEFNPKISGWVKGKFSIPDVLYDRCFYGMDFHSKQCMNIVNWLKTKKDTRFLGFGLPNKLDIHQVLSKSKLAPYLPATEKVASPAMVKGYLLKTNPIILKPINGSQGFGIYCIEKKKGSYTVRTDKKQKQVSFTFSDEAHFLHWLKKLFSFSDFLIQPYLTLTDEQNRPFDVRSLIQKGEYGDWVVLGKGIRVGKDGGIVSNLSAGASIVSFEAWLKTLHEDTQKYVTEEINDVLTSIPFILEDAFPPLFELGVDIGVAKNNSIWILDTNSKPGRKLLLMDQPHLKEQLYEAPLLYAKFIYERKEKEGRHLDHEKTLPR